MYLIVAFINKFCVSKHLLISCIDIKYINIPHSVLRMLSKRQVVHISGLRFIALCDNIMLTLSSQEGNTENW